MMQKKQFRMFFSVFLKKRKKSCFFVKKQKNVFFKETKNRWVVFLKTQVFLNPGKKVMMLSMSIW